MNQSSSATILHGRDSAIAPAGTSTPAARPAIFFFEGCDFATFPVGGQLAMARSLIRIFGPNLALVGMSSGEVPVGRWVQREFDGVPYWFFSACEKEASARRPFLPARLTYYLGLRRYRRQILALGCRDALVQAPEGLLAVSGWDLDSLCFMFPGVESPLKISRYGFARKIYPMFDRWLFRALRGVDAIVACADEKAVDQLAARSQGMLERRRITQLPTCVNTDEFRPGPAAEARAALGIPGDALVIANCGRIGRFKGWDLLVDALAVLRQSRPDARLIFIGDGEDRGPLEAYVAAQGLKGAVTITGFQRPAAIARYWQAADVAVFGSHVEGWSVAMLEALACGKPLVSTDVSGVRQMVAEGKNGYILRSRDAREFANAVESALDLRNAEAVSIEIADRYGLAAMGRRLSALWEPMRRLRVEA